MQAGDHFSPIAEAYARGRTGYPTDLFEYLGELCGKHELAWDVATGSGQAIPPLAQRFVQVVATDLSPELLARAPALPNVTYRVARAEHGPLADTSADLVTVAQALHWFDLDAFWREVRRVLKPGGIFAYWGYNWPNVNEGVDAALNELRAQLQPYWPERSARLHAEYVGIVAPFARVDAPSFVMEAEWTRDDYMAHLASWSAVRYCCEQTGHDPLQSFSAGLKAVWPSGIRWRVHWPLVLRVYRG